MDDAGTHDTANPAEFAMAMMQQRVHEGPRFVAGRGMHHDARSFIEHHDVLVLEKNVERDLFWLRDRCARLGPNHGNDFTGSRRMRWFDRLVIHANMALFNESLDGTT